MWTVVVAVRGAGCRVLKQDIRHDAWQPREFVVTIASWLSNLFHQRHISPGDILQKLRVRIEKHNVKMLNRMNTLQSGPILEPNHICAPTSPYESLVHKLVDFAPDLREKIAFWIRGVRSEPKLRPNDEMGDASVYAVWEIIVENLQIICRRLARLW